MSLETGTYIDDLVITNPLSSDPRSEGDDHIRLLKKVLKNTFPNVAGAVGASDAELSFVAGVTSAIQTQLNALGTAAALKAPLASPTFTGTVVVPTLALTNELAIADGGTGKGTAGEAFDAIKQVASTTYSGVTELATGAEAVGYAASPSSAVVCTPYSLASVRAYNVSGYQKLPGGLLVQWGRSGNLGDLAGGPQTAIVNFPTAFPNGVLCVLPSFACSSAGTVNAAVSWDFGTTTLSAAHFDYNEFSGWTQANVYIVYIAIGY